MAITPINLLKSSSRGYSIIELVVAIGILGVIAIASTNLFLRTAVGSSRDNTTRLIKQNGDYAITLIESSLRGALRLAPDSDCSSDMNQIHLVNSQNQVESWYFLPGTQGNGAILYSEPSEGIEQETLVDSRLSILELDVSCSQDEFSGVTRINVSFELTTGNSDRQSEVGTELFQTSVTLRNR